jgi:hypothetical protein
METVSKAIAVDLPIPDEPPVMMTVFFSIFCSFYCQLIFYLLLFDCSVALVINSATSFGWDS